MATTRSEPNCAMSEGQKSATHSAAEWQSCIYHSRINSGQVVSLFNKALAFPQHACFMFPYPFPQAIFIIPELELLSFLYVLIPQLSGKKVTGV